MILKDFEKIVGVLVFLWVWKSLRESLSLCLKNFKESSLHFLLFFTNLKRFRKPLVFRFWKSLKDSWGILVCIWFWKYLERSQGLQVFLCLKEFERILAPVISVLIFERILGACFDFERMWNDLGGSCIFSFLKESHNLF